MSETKLSEAYGSIIKPIKKTIKRHLFSDAFLIRRQYVQRTELQPDLSTPRDLSEKVLWLKLNDRSPLHARCADKVRVRDYVSLLIGPEHLARALHVTHEPGDIDPATIREERFVIKTNHDQGGVFICKDRGAFDWDSVRTEVTRRLGVNKYYEFREHQYKSIKPAIMVEEFLEAEDGGNIREIKFYCFHGKPGFIQVVLDRFDDRTEGFYDPDWKRMRFVGPAPQFAQDIPRPPCLERLLRASEILSAAFLFCRIDFLYGGGDRARFGEVTFHHGAGLIRFEPPEYERAFGDMIDLSRIDETKRRQAAILERLAAVDTGARGDALRALA